MMYRLIVVGILALLSGCSSISYEEPLNGARAKVRFSSNSEGMTIVRGYEDANCQGEKEWMRLRKGYLVNSSPKSLEIPFAEGLHENEFKEFYLNSTSGYVFMFVGENISGRTVYSCGVPTKIEIDEGKMYELAYTYDNQNCTATFFEIKGTGSVGFKKVKIAHFTNHPVGFGEQCTAMFKKMRLY